MRGREGKKERRKAGRLEEKCENKRNKRKEELGMMDVKKEGCNRQERKKKNKKKEIKMKRRIKRKINKINKRREDGIKKKVKKGEKERWVFEIKKR